MKIIIVAFLMTMPFFLSCNREYTLEEIEGDYYEQYKFDEETKPVFELLTLKNGKYINDHGLYYDLDRKSVYRKPYHPEVYPYTLKKNHIYIEDPTNSVEFGQLTFKITKKINGKIILQEIHLKNLKYTSIFQSEK